jgi:hypothetical protein
MYSLSILGNDSSSMVEDMKEPGEVLGFWVSGKVVLYLPLPVTLRDRIFKARSLTNVWEQHTTASLNSRHF